VGQGTRKNLRSPPGSEGIFTSRVGIFEISSQGKKSAHNAAKSGPKGEPRGRLKNYSIQIPK